MDSDFVPNYTFIDIINSDDETFNTRNHDKPILLEFWATWCSPCIPAMQKLSDIQNKYGNEIEILTVSSDSRENLMRFVENTQTNLRIAYDSSYISTFKHQYIPHLVIIDRNGNIKARTSPNYLTDNIIEDLIEGNEIAISENSGISNQDYHIIKNYKSNDFRFELTTQNKEYGFSNNIKTNSDNKPISLDFKNVSIYRLMTDIYQLSSAARIYSIDEIPENNKYCFSLEQSETYPVDLLSNAKNILNKHLDIKSELVEHVPDLLYVLEINDQTKLPKPSNSDNKSISFMGPTFNGTNIDSYNLIEYLENEVQTPVKDKTELNYLFDIELRWEYEDSKSLNRELKKYGLVLGRSEKEKAVMLKLTVANEVR